MPARTNKPKRSVSSVRPDDIDRQRKAHIETINRARQFQTGQSALLDKATRLLTERWAHASWTSRATILRTVDWLLRVAICNPGPTPIRSAALRSR